MPGDGIAAALLDVAEYPLEALVGERLDPAAVVADDVMVVLDRVAQRLEPRDAVAEVDPLDETLLGQHLEDPIDAGKPDSLAPRNQFAVDFLRSYAAVLRVQEVDHACAGQAVAIAGFSKFGESLL